jgi:hypothetical protein
MSLLDCHPGITPEEKAELLRLIEGGAYDESFWLSRWRASREISPEEKIRETLKKIDTSTIQGKRQARKLTRKLRKLAGIANAFRQAGYAQNWTKEQKRLDNLQHAAIYISRANSGFHFYA